MEGQKALPQRTPRHRPSMRRPRKTELRPRALTPMQVLPALIAETRRVLTEEMPLLALTAEIPARGRTVEPPPRAPRAEPPLRVAEAEPQPRVAKVEARRQVLTAEPRPRVARVEPTPLPIVERPAWAHGHQHPGE